MVNGSSVLDLAATTHWDESVGRQLIHYGSRKAVRREGWIALPVPMTMNC